MYFFIPVGSGYTSILYFIAIPHAIYINTGVQTCTHIQNGLYVTVLWGKYLPSTANGILV